MRTFLPKNPPLRRISRPAWIVLMLQERRRARVAAAAGGGPAVPSGYKLWLQAELLAVGLGNPIETWPDQSGNSNHATQETISFQPTLEQVAFAGKTFKVARFDTVDDGMATPLVITDPSPFSVFLMWRPADLDMTTALVSSASLDWMMGTYLGSMLCYFTTWTTAGTVNTNDFYLFEVRITPGQPLTWGYLNGVQTELQPYFIGSASPEEVTLGSSGMTGYPGGCDAAEILIYDRMLSDEEAIGVRNYFQSKYNFLQL